jgi:(2R)-3-sulfolactate dehydrogenase (NADP+)
MSKAVVSVTPEEIEAAARDALISAGASAVNATPVARAMALAEAEGNQVCGLYYAPIFCSHLRVGKVDGSATPHVICNGPSIVVDAKCGFAHPAIEAALPILAEAGIKHGIAAAAIRNSYNCLALAHHVVPIASRGLIGICVSNAPASLAPPGASMSLLGTNPIAFATPLGSSALVVDQAMAAVTKTEMTLRKNRGEQIPIGWGQDANGHSTTDPARALAGSLLAAGNQKGANIALIIEILAAALTGSQLSVRASSFSNDEGGPPRVGQFLLAVDPAKFSAGYSVAVTSLLNAYSRAGVRLPGHNRRTSTTVSVDAELWRRVCAISSNAEPRKRGDGSH